MYLLSKFNQDLRTKLSVIKSLLPLFTSHYCIILIETWLSSEIFNFELDLDSFQIFRQDRNLYNSLFSRGSGVLNTPLPVFEPFTSSVCHIISSITPSLILFCGDFNIPHAHWSQDHLGLIGFWNLSATSSHIVNLDLAY